MDTNSWKLRHPVGPDAGRRIQWRASLTDEQFIDHGSLSDEDWYRTMQETFGRDLRPKK